MIPQKGFHINQSSGKGGLYPNEQIDQEGAGRYYRCYYDVWICLYCLCCNRFCNRSSSSGKQTNVKADNGAKVSTAANGTATVKALPKTTKKSVTVASKVVVDGVSYKVTAIGAKAFANATKATTVTLPASIKTIGAQAFTGAKSVKTIVIKSASVKVDKTAFKGVDTKKMTIKVSGMSAKQLKAFKAQLKKAGFKGTVKKVSK